MPTLKAIHIAKLLKKPATQAKLVKEYAFANAPNRTKNKKRNDNKELS